MNEIKQLEQKIIACKKCELYKTRKNPVVGEGNKKAKIMFIGEAPGFNEDRLGRPFVGKAGKVFDELLKSIDLKREEVYITNILKCRPPNNRNPTKKEIIACAPYLDEQIKIIKPKKICCLGNFSTKYILEKFGLKDKIQGISKIRRRIFKVNSIIGNIEIIPLYHPAVATYDKNKFETLKKDFEVIKNENKTSK